MIQVIRGGAHNTPEIQAALKEVSYRRSPGWLGRFSYQQFKKGETQALHPVLRAEANYLAGLVPDQKFNTVFFQNYKPGEDVATHKDPYNNKGHTVIGLYGDFSETRLWVCHARQHLPAEFNANNISIQHPGDIYILECTIDGVQGQPHYMRWPEGATGERWAIILNTIGETK